MFVHKADVFDQLWLLVSVMFQLDGYHDVFVTVFFEVVENTAIGGFNGEVIVGSKPKGKS